MAPWNDSEDRQLLLSVISVAQVNPHWEDVATQMGKTKESVRQRFAKLKKEAGDPPASATSGGTAPSSAPTAATPRKRKPRTKAKKTAPADDDEDEDEGAPLTKKFKVKPEPKDDDEDDA